MAKLDGQNLAVSWFLVDLTNPRVQDLVTAAETVQAQKRPGAVLGVNRNGANTRAIVKVLASAAEFQGPLPGVVRNAILRVFTEADHHEAVAMVTSLEWGPQE